MMEVVRNMPNLQISQCNCYPKCAGACGVEGGNATTPATFCTGCLENSCTANAISFTIPAFDITCSDQIRNDDSLRYAVSIPETSISFGMQKDNDGCSSPNNSCGWEYATGRDNPFLGFLDFTLCPSGSTTDKISRIECPPTTCGTAAGNCFSISSYAQMWATNRMTSPCGSTPLDASPPDCAGIVMHVPFLVYGTGSGGGGYYNVTYVSLIMGYKAFNIDDCDEQVPCPSAYSGKTPDLFWSNVADASAITNLVIY